MKMFYQYFIIQISSIDFLAASTYSSHKGFHAENRVADDDRKNKSSLHFAL